MPTTRMVIRWKKEHKEFALLYDEAIRDRLDIFEDEVITIADESENDFKLVKKGGKQVKVLDAEVISRAKLRVDVRKAHLKAYRPERWGEQSTLNVNNYDAMGIDNMTQDEMDKKIEELESKEAVVREPKAA
jgi:U3 small nucleolar ribonucleoprotein component